jgi:hypothetical protein
MLSVLRDETAKPEARMWAAEKAAPYVHPKLSSVEMSTDPERPMTVTFAWLPPQL